MGASELAAQVINAQSGNYTAVVADKYKLIQMTSVGAATLTIPANGSQPFAIGESFDIVQWGAGQITVSPAGGVALGYTPGNKIAAQYGMASCIKMATDTWLLAGNLTT